MGAAPTLAVQVDRDDEDDTGVAAVANGLRIELAANGVVNVSDSSVAGELLIVNTSGSAILNVVTILRDWVSRNRRTVEVRFGEDALKITGVTARTQEALIDAWVGRILDSSTSSERQEQQGRHERGQIWAWLLDAGAGDADESVRPENYNAALNSHLFGADGRRGFSPMPVTIFLADESAHERVEEALVDLLATIGFEISDREEPIIGSWFQRMRAQASRALRTEAGIMATHAAEAKLVHYQDAAITATLLQNLGPVLGALQYTQDAVVRAGALLIVKVGGTIAVHQLTAAQQLMLDHSPDLVWAPREVLTSLGADLVGGTGARTDLPEIRASQGRPE